MTSTQLYISFLVGSNYKATLCDHKMLTAVSRDAVFIVLKVRLRDKWLSFARMYVMKEWEKSENEKRLTKN